MWIVRIQRTIAARALGSCSNLWRLSCRELSSSAPAATETSAKATTASENVQPELEEYAAEAARSSPSSSSSSWRGLKALFTLTAAAAVGGVSYVTYAYSSQEVEQAVKHWRQSSTHVTTPQDGNLLDIMQNAVYNTSVQVSAKVADVYLDLRKSIEVQVQGFAAPSSDKLLPDLSPQEQHVYTIVLDLNDTLVYSDWKRERGWGTFKRPGVEAFLEKLAHLYEIVVYSDQLSFYVDPILERLDQKGCIRYRLSRDATHYVNGVHYRDLSKLNRDPKKVLYISGHALEHCLQPENAISIKPWKLEDSDTELLDLLPFLEFVAMQRPADVRNVVASYRGHDIPTEFKERAKLNQKRMQERKQQSRFWQR